MKKLSLLVVLFFVSILFTNCESDLDNEINETENFENIKLIDKDDAVTPGEKDD